MNKISNLTTAAFWARTVIKYVLFFIIFLIVARIVWLIGTKVYQAFFPKAPPKATIQFGKLPELEFPNQNSIPKFSYALETATGEFPKTPTTLPVFVVPPPRSSLLALEQSRNVARRLGYEGGEESISESIYRFRRRDVPATLVMNIVSGAFSIHYDFSADPRPIQARPPSPNESIQSVKTSLANAGLFKEDLEEGQTTHSFFAYSGGKIVSVSSLSEANFVRVNLFRQNYEDLPVVTPTGEANVWFLVAGAGERLVGGEYHYFAVDKKTSSTYPIKTAQNAWEELKKGGGIVIKKGESKENVVIRRILLAYYDSDKPQDFFQPVYVFEGDNGFVAYIPAVTQDYYVK